MLRHVKTYLRTTTLQERLNYLMLLHVHKEITDAVSSLGQVRLPHGALISWDAFNISEKFGNMSQTNIGFFVSSVDGMHWRVGVSMRHLRRMTVASSVV